eukprot:365278-Pelagomonas_calceolata.AAC.1
MKRVPRINSRYPLSRGGHGGNREHSATATPPTSKVRHIGQLLPDQRHVHLVEVKYCEDTQRPKQNVQSSNIAQAPSITKNMRYASTDPLA